jgi:hypothetical protein
MGIRCGKDDIKKDIKDDIKNKSTKNHKVIRDRFTTYEQLEDELRNFGLESSNLIVGIDFTKSNSWNGNGGPGYYPNDNLHSLFPSPNLYEQVITLMGHTLENFDDDKLIPTYGFGDESTTDKSVFSFLRDPMTGLDTPCYTFNQVLGMYKIIVNDVANGKIKMSGPTSFVPIINKAIEIVSMTNSYHILLIIADGEISDKQKTIDAIVRASKYPLSIVCVGVGRANFTVMEELDDDIPTRKFDNFQFVNFYKTMQNCENLPVEFARHALMEIPDQYDYIKKHLL